MYETNLHDSQCRQKKNKKDNKNALGALRKEIETLNAKITKAAAEDKAQNNRQLQTRQMVKQAEEAALLLSGEIAALGEIPEEESKRSQEADLAWKDAKHAHAAAQSEIEQIRASTDRERQAVEHEALSAARARERLTARNAKLKDHQEKLDSATAQDLDEKERKDSLQAAKDFERSQIEKQNAEQVSYFYRACQESRYFVQQACQQIRVLESAYNEQLLSTKMAPPVERPLTPEGDLPGTNPQKLAAAASSFRSSAFGSPDNPNVALRSHSGSLRRSDTRPRSTSGLSGHSVYADFEDQDPAPPMPTRAFEKIRERGRQHSGGSGSGSSAGSQRDPASPLVGSGAQVSPIGKRSPVQRSPVWNN